MSAAEYGLPSPAGAPSWLSLAQNVLSEIRERWDTTSCHGGLKWQISSSSPGFDYKNSISNGLYFQLAARLAKSTGNPDYVTEAERVFDWVQSVGLIDDKYNVYDGTDDTKGCTSVDHDQWSYNVCQGLRVGLGIQSWFLVFQKSPIIDSFVASALIYLCSLPFVGTPHIIEVLITWALTYTVVPSCKH